MRMSEVSYPAKVYILIALAGAMTLIYGISRLAEAKEYQDPYPFRAQFARLREVKQQLQGQRAVGYLSNLEPGERGSTQLYFPTQYVLAPTLLVPIEDRPDVEFVLGNFTRQEDYHARGREWGLEVMREYPMGVVLYRRTRKEPVAPAPAR